MIKHLIRHFVVMSKYWKELQFDYSSTISIKSKFEGANKIYSHSYFSGKLGYGSYIGPFCDITANIGRFTSISPYVRTNNGKHPYAHPYATTCPMFYSTRKQNGHTFVNKNTFEEISKLPEIGNDCWIGENVFIAGGVMISDGTVVLSGAVVSKNTPPYSVVGGVPAKVLRYRYDEDTIMFLLKFQWWNKDKDWLNRNSELLCDIDRLKSKVINNDQ